MDEDRYAFRGGVGEEAHGLEVLAQGRPWRGLAEGYSQRGV